jgi:gliding motility-associated-like protein
VPVPDFSASTVAGCGPLAVSFKDLSTGAPIYWTWDFGNGQISSLQNPSTAYSIPGTYTVTLIVRNKDGANSIRKTDYITVFPYPSANFGSNLNVACAPANVSFNDLSTPGQGSLTQWTWNLGDGTTSTQPNPSHAYSGTGYYNVSLKVTNSGGCSNTATRGRYIRVVPGAQAAFSWSQSTPGCSAPFDINFINQTSGPGTLSYTWDLGNGSTSTQTAPITTYPSNNPYTVTLIAKSSLGCSDTVTKAVSFQGGTPAITAPGQACVNTTVNFQNGSSPAPVSSSWDFGDGSTADVANPAKTYTATGTYTVTLTNIYSSCTASITKTIQIVNAAAVTFTADKTAACAAPLTVTFTDQTPNATGWQWDFGDGGTSTNQNPQHTYTGLGNFDVQLTVTTGTGCTATGIKKQFIRIAAPTATINGGAVQGCVSPAVIRPTANVTAVDGIASYAWSSPDAASSSGTNTANPSFTYTSQGYHDLALTITTTGGCTFNQTFKNTVLTGTPTIPVFTADNTSPCAHQPVTFTSTSAPVDFWVWQFGDGSTSRTAAPVQHKYNDIGNHSVSLTVVHSGCQQTLTKPNYIFVNAPIAGFSYKIDCSDRRNVTFTDTSKIDLTKGNPSYKWTFGDGSPDVLVNTPPYPPAIIPHSYPTIGTYTVTETVTNGSCSDTRTTIIDLAAIVPSFTAPDSACKNAKFDLTSTSAPASSIAFYSWQVGSAPYTTSTAATTTYTTSLPDTGAYILSLIVTDAGGCQYLPVSRTIHIIGPTARFTPAAGGCANSPIQFTDQSTPYNANYPITSWTLDGGDGTPAATAPPFTHSYAQTGSYTAILTVTDSKGCTDKFTAPTIVQITAPRAGFFAPDTLYCPNAPLPFKDSSQGNNLVYSWDFGDGTVINGLTTPGTTHPYTTDQKYYSVKLKITDAAGCSDSVTRTSYIHIQSPIAAFTLQDSTGICLPLQTSFFPAGQYYDSLYWNFGDGSTSNLDTTTHFYNSYGTFHDTLFLQGAGGCLSFATRNVYVYNPNTTGFSYGPSLTGCDSFRVNFQLTPPPYTRFTLNFGDGSADSSGNRTPSHEYSLPSTYGPQLVLQDSTGCIVGIGPLSGNIKVLGAIPFFNMNQRKFCDTGTIFFTDFSITNDNPVSMAWDFGDGSTATGTVGDLNTENPSHSYTSPGLVTPRLTLTTSSGCTENYTDTAYIYQTPHPVITLPDPSCINAPLQFQGSLTTPANPVDTVNWTWNFGNGTTSALEDPLVSFSQAGPYTVSLRTFVTFGCSDTTSRPLTINPLPVIKGPAEITTPVGLPVTIPFTYSSNVINYSWTPPINLSCTDCPDPIATLTFDALYIVTVTDSNNCMSKDSILVKTVCNGKNYFIPNTFSPNNDGVNDVFYPRGNNLYNIQSMRVFNRWGQLVFERRNFPANTASEGWDGTFNGHPAPSDAYVYIIEVICDNAQIVALKGDITLIR